MKKVKLILAITIFFISACSNDIVEYTVYFNPPKQIINYDKKETRKWHKKSIWLIDSIQVIPDAPSKFYGEKIFEGDWIYHDKDSLINVKNQFINNKD